MFAKHEICLSKKSDNMPHRNEHTSRHHFGGAVTHALPAPPPPPDYTHTARDAPRPRVLGGLGSGSGVAEEDGVATAKS